VQHGAAACTDLVEPAGPGERMIIGSERPGVRGRV
jgi:hypothetical protein